MAMKVSTIERIEKFSNGKSCNFVQYENAEL